MWKLYIKKDDSFKDTFNDKYEYRIYKYLCGQKLWFWEYNVKKNNCLIDSYAEWEECITKKFKVKSKEYRKEFAKYLEYRDRMIEHVTNIYIIIVSALSAVIVTDGLWKNISSMDLLAKDFVSIISNSIMLLVLAVIFSVVIGMIHNVLFKPTLKKYFYEEYKRIIESIKS